MGRHRESLVRAAPSLTASHAAASSGTAFRFGLEWCTVNIRRASSLVLSLAVCAACSRSEPEPRRDQAPAKSSGGASPMILARGVRLVRAGAGSDAARVIREERDRAKGDGRDLVVYVGAKWCEPCKVFHGAAQKGELDGEFPDLTILEFDLDEDRERLAPAGYVGEFIPLFAIPDAEGRASDRKFEGSVKGGGAVAHIAPRLRKILGK